MKNYDLNLEFCHIDILPPTDECLCSLITSDVTWVIPDHAVKMASIQYNPSAQILKIVHHNFSLKISDFSFYNYIPEIVMVPFQIAVATLAANNYHLTFISKNGVFKPIIKAKELHGSKNHAFIQYDSYPNYQLTLSNFTEFQLITKEYQLISNNQNNDTTIIVSPVDKDAYEYLRASYSFLKPCKEVFLAGKDKVLVPIDQQGGIFFEGRLFFNEMFEWTSKLLYDYEIIDEDIERIEKIETDIPTKEETYQLVYHALANLKDADKNKVFPTFIARPTCAEWQNDEIQMLVAKYLTTAFPSQYVLYNEKESPSDYVALAKTNQQTLIPLNHNVYSELSSLDQNIIKWAHSFLAKKYANNFLNGNLSINEQNNLNILKKFCNYFATSYFPLKQWSKRKQIEGVKFLVVNDYINHVGTLLTEWNVAIIDYLNLKTIANTLSAGCEIIAQFEESNNQNQFKTAWLKATIEFLSKLNWN